MAQINIGSIKFKWQGAYAGGTAYTVDDVVSYQGSSYICIQASTGNLPTDTAYFEQMSQAGTNGTDGTDLTTTLTTQGDILYRDGSGLQRLGAGTSGQVLQTNGTGANPSWADASGAILQIKSVSSGAQATITTNPGWNGTAGAEYTATTLTITKIKADSLLRVDYAFKATHQSDYNGQYWITYDHAGISETAIENDDTYGATHSFDYSSATTSDMGGGIAGSVYLDVTTTNPITIRHRFGTANNNVPTYINRTVNGNGNNDSFAGINTVTITEIDSSKISHTKGTNINGD